MLKITIIYDSSKDNLNLETGWGFSCLIEWGDIKILFDTGGDQAGFFSNIQKLNINLRQITHIICSHRHKDHTAGFEEVLKNISNPKIYLPQDFPSSLVTQIPSNIDTETMTLFTEIAKNIYSLPLVGKYRGMIIHEQSVIFNTPQGLIVLTGCAHPGILNILKAVKEKFPGKKIHIVAGGFHLYKSWRFVSKWIVRQIKKMGVEKVMPCHCTGEIASSRFEQSFKDNFIKAGTGKILEITV